MNTIIEITNIGIGHKGNRFAQVMEGINLKIAIVTGASSGLGREYAKLLDKEDLDEIWLVARREKLLRDLAGELVTATRNFPVDLTAESALTQIGDSLRLEQPIVRFLINAAGLGKIGSEEDIIAADLARMIDLNCKATVLMTHLAIPYMGEDSHIMQICSCSAFQPIPYLNVYAATKSFLLHYSRALAVELAPKGIVVSAICPYWIKDTEFIPIAKDTKNSAYIKGFPFAGRQAVIAEKSFAAAKKGKMVITPDAVSTLHRMITSILPHQWLMTASKWFHGKMAKRHHG